ncbi:two-component system sensor histidine kinase NtrB [Ketobacter sp.]|uniref:two-component system sensor histidine kinase NtrB n=1 Tax=Ketobacter sp. TaxID=2083498 RepID=UPI000F11B861|nr:ATP-binding protein [Ketobacter sp.]RLU00884.1 MAG: PAS domain-containing sensor histidine kinase [Ketobacter sp.]
MSEKEHQNASALEEVRQNQWRLLQIYLYYRLALALSLVGAYFLETSQSAKSSGLDERLYFATISTYLVLAIMGLFINRLRAGRISIQIFIVITIDIISIALLEYANGESNSNLTILLIVSVAAGGILVEGILATFFAAVATLAILYKQILNGVLHGTFKQEDFLQTAIIGIACFATSILAQQISRRLRESAALAGRQAEDLANLEELNHLIIQRMRTGIVVVNQDNDILLINDACWKMFGMPSMSKHQSLENFSPQLAEQLEAWRQDPYKRPKPFRPHVTGPEVQSNFTLMEAAEQANILIFIDDNSRMAQQAQQLKLASLGGLTASIAHEIRNPLGAISHAAQLLQESTELNKGDARLCEIIHQHTIRANKVIENVLQLSRRKQVEPELLNMHDWLKNFIQDFQSNQDQQCKIKFVSKKKDLQFRIDPSQIQQVLTNLFQNGIRYSEQNTGQRTLTVVADLNIQSEQPTLDIIDQGPGVPADQQDKIFEPFYTSEKSGTGLGLYIARELCEANQARLDYHPVTSGSCFRITFSHPSRIVTI